ncbi:hypothetical protein KIH39_00655 [Telmatocola sphagniphila]|uniref:DUF6677 domain-containing protein n=1 Tax=Telmatocola sphagniphila TaxID=1123043 RepID=A0A8E6B5D9_9BACT|nr:DUF6677 family protein [Telmatocola sphagniphila]QVL32460.1 hypothetical protein KIH39_00655 [Telmatocola sphagniphila]
MKEETYRIIAAPPQKPDVLAGILSYLIPGLGQMSQGRMTKGLIFFVCLHGLFFYGLWLGEWQNVYITNKEAGNRPPDPRAHMHLVYCLTARPHYVGQFFIGMSAWPAIYQFMHYDETKEAGPRFGKLEREPSDEKLNDMQRNDQKVFDLAWVYTVIAGVLNILVIYDAIAGAAFTIVPVTKKKIEEAAKSEAAAPPSPIPAGNAKTVITEPIKTIEIKREGSI